MDILNTECMDGYRMYGYIYRMYDGDGGSDGKDDADPIFYQNLHRNQIRFEPNLNLMLLS